MTTNGIQPVAVIHVALFPDGHVEARAAGCNAVMANGMLMTAAIDLTAKFQEASKGPQIEVAKVVH